MDAAVGSLEGVAPKTAVGVLQPTRPTWLADLLHASFAVFVTAIAALIPLVNNPRFYFYDDTQSGAYGIWFEIGSKLRSGEWPIFSAQAWGAGNYTAEGQWGLWNPLIMLVGLGASVTNSPVFFATALKISFLCILSLGVFLLSREYGANRTWALISGVSVPLTGFTVYMDAASWVTGLMVFALLPLTWYGLKRIYEGKSPVTGLISGYLLVTIGYVHGTLMLVLVMIGLLLEVWAGKTLAGFIRLLSAGVILGLVAVAVYLPGVLTAPVTARESEISNTGFLTPDLTGFASSWIGSGLPQVSGWWGTYSPVPLLYIAWFLPLVGLLNFDRARMAFRDLRGILFFGAVSLALVLAPSDLGPLRFPVRLTPYVSLALLIILSVLLSKYRIPSLNRSRVVGLICLLAAGAYIAWAQIPNPGVHLKFAALSALGLGSVVVLLYGGVKARWAKWRPLPAILLVGVTLATAAGQHHYFKSTPLPDFGLPDDVRAYDVPLQKAEGVTFISGNPAGLGPEIWDETLLANSWYLNERPVQNLYTPIMFKTYAEDLCLDPHGWTCPLAGAKLFTKDETTGTQLADLLSVDSVQLIRESSDEGTNKIGAVPVPEGWHVAETTQNTILWVRNSPHLDTANVVWESNGVQLTTTSMSSQKMVLRIDSLPQGDAKAVLSRLAWPGYSVQGAKLDDPLRGYLVQLDLSESTVGSEITIEFQPPGWPLIIFSMIVAMTLMLVWLLVDGWRRLRR